MTIVLSKVEIKPAIHAPGIAAAQARSEIALAPGAIFERNAACKKSYGQCVSVAARCQARSNGRVCEGSAAVRRRVLPWLEILRGSYVSQTWCSPSAADVHHETLN